MADQPAVPPLVRAMPREDQQFLRDFLHQLDLAAPETRTMFATMMAQMRRARWQDIAEPPGPESRAWAETLAVEGVVDLGTLIDGARVAEMRAHFDRCSAYEGHASECSDGVPHDLATLRASAHYACFDRADILRCPHLIEIANDPRLLQAAEAYLGCPPTIYNINAWWSLARGGRPATVAQGLHRDHDDFRFVTLFIFLTPVGPTSGAHRFIRYSHDKQMMLRVMKTLGHPEAELEARLAPLFHWDVYYAAAKEAALMDQLAKVWTGPAGSAILADTHGIHMGVPLTEGARLMLWIRYGLGPNAHSLDAIGGPFTDIVGPRVAQTPRAQYVNRLMLDA